MSILTCSQVSIYIPNLPYICICQNKHQACHHSICNNYIMGTSGSGVYILQTTSAHGISNIYHVLCVGKRTAAQSFFTNDISVFIVELITFDCGFNT